VTRQQKWASKALQCVKAAKSPQGEKAEKKRDEKKYATHCMKGPSILRQAGLVQALAFFKTRGDEGKRYASDLEAIVAQGDGGKKQLEERAHSAELPEYLALTRDVVAAAVWLRRFAQAELKTDDVPTPTGKGS
jgi:CRISPR-associated protein Cmr5